MATSSSNLFWFPLISSSVRDLRYRVRATFSERSKKLPLGSSKSFAFFKVNEELQIASDGEKGKSELGSKGKKKDVEISEELEVLWDDGYGSTTVKDYLDSAKDMILIDGGPPRWFCPVDCGRPVQGSPVLFFLPGVDGLGLGLCLHHKALGRYFAETIFSYSFLS